MAIQAISFVLNVYSWKGFIARAHTCRAPTPFRNMCLAIPLAREWLAGEAHRVEELQPPSYARTAQVISVRVLTDSRRAYGERVDDATLQRWVTETLRSLLTQRTRVTTLVPVLAFRDIRALAEQNQHTIGAD